MKSHSYEEPSLLCHHNIWYPTSVTPYWLQKWSMHQWRNQLLNISATRAGWLLTRNEVYELHTTSHNHYPRILWKFGTFKSLENVRSPVGFTDVLKIVVGKWIEKEPDPSEPPKHHVDSRNESDSRLSKYDNVEEDRNLFWGRTINKRQKRSMAMISTGIDVMDQSLLRLQAWQLSGYEAEFISRKTPCRFISGVIQPPIPINSPTTISSPLPKAWRVIITTQFGRYGEKCSEEGYKTAWPTLGHVWTCALCLCE